MHREIKERNVLLVYVYSCLTLGIYSIYWLVSTKRDINSLGGEIPSTWINLIPFAGLYYSYKYCEGFAQKVKKDDNTILYFLLSLFVGIVIPGIVQSELNKVSKSSRYDSSSVTKQAA